MPLLKVQLNHPGNEKPFSIGKGYHNIDGLLIREWNNDEVHYRKFIRNEGEYLTSLNKQPIKDKLLFWGEWEGNSVFYPNNNLKNRPNGIHVPFHSNINIGNQNTDPYIYGDFFKYATCSQTGELVNLLPGSMILFGTTKDIGFELDTVFIVKKFESAYSVFSNAGTNYSPVYIEETLKQLAETYMGPVPSLNKRLYHSQSWWDNNEYFSFVPCKLDDNKGFQKALLPIPPMAKQKVGHPYQHLNQVSHITLWNFIVDEVLTQGFCLGVKFTEPILNDKILNGMIFIKSLTNAKCGADSKKITPKKSC